MKNSNPTSSNTSVNHQQPRKLKLAFIGAGGISKQHAAGVLVHSNKIQCTAICDLSEYRLNQRKEQLGGAPLCFTNWDTMFAECGDEIEAVVICLPHHLHAPAILAAAKAGKHVLCEKPLCLDLDEANDLIKAVKDSGITFMPAHNQLFAPYLQKARKMIDEGTIGKVRWVRSTDCFVNPTNFENQWRGKMECQGGGVLIDTGYHPCYRLTYLAGADFVRVRASFGRYIQNIEGEDSASVLVDFANGVTGEILTSWAYRKPYGSYKIHVIGERGEIFGDDQNLYLLPTGFSEPAKITLRQDAKDPTFELQMSYFADCILSGKKPLQSIEDSRKVLEMIMLAAKDAEGWQKNATLQLA